jgi:1-acyl-sn-glycerol-3-phosphate acyltransferase
MPPPHYPSVDPFAVRAIATRLIHRHRSFRSDSVNLSAKMSPPIRYIGLEHLPAHGPLLLTANHYSRPGFNTAWIAIGITSALPVDVAWVMSNEWLFEGNRFAFVLRPAMRFVLKSLTLTYQFLSMPTMVPGYSTSQQRSAGVRQAIERLRAHPDLVLGLTPEGMDVPGGSLGLPPAGAGRFIQYLHQMGLPIFPVGVCEKDDCLCIHFGSPYSLDLPSLSANGELDLAIRQLVMEHIRQVLP